MVADADGHERQSGRTGSGAAKRIHSTSAFVVKTTGVLCLEVLSYGLAGYTTPWSIMASTTLTKPAMLAPFM